MFNFLSQPAERILQKATRLRSEGKFGKAISLLQKAAKENPDHLQLLIELGTLYFQTDQYKSACAVFKKAQRLSPSGDSDVLSIIESLHFDRGKPVESGELLLHFYAEKRELEHAERVIGSLTESQLWSLAEKYDRIYRNSVKYKSGSPQRSLTIGYCLVGLHSALHDYKRSFAMLSNIAELSASERQLVLKEGERLGAREWGNPVLLISLGDLYATNGLTEKATENYMRAVDSDASKLDEVAEKIRSLLDTSESVVSLKALFQLVISRSRFDEALELIGRLKRLDIDQEEITRLYSEVIRLDPSSSQAHCLLAEHFHQQKRFDSAASEYVRAVELNPTERKTVGKLEEILNEAPDERLLDIAFETLSSTEHLDTLVRILSNTYQSNQPFSQNIAEKLNKILAADLSNVGALELLGKIWCDEGHPDKATRVFSYLLQIDEDSARRTLGSLTRLVEENPELSSARVALADAHVVLNDSETALDAYFRALDADPESAPTLVPKIDLLVRERRSLARRAASLYAERKYLDPLVRHYAAGEALALAQDYSGAVQQFGLCIESRPDCLDECIAAYQRMLHETDSADVRIALGSSYSRVGRVTEALDEFNRAASLDPKKISTVLARLLELKKMHDSPRIRNTIIDLLIGRRLHSEATEEIRLASERFPSHTGSFCLARARISQDKGLFKEAVHHSSAALEHDPSLASDVIKVLEHQKQMDHADIPVLTTLAQAYRLSKQYNTAADELRRIAEVSSDKADWAIDQLEKMAEEDFTNPKLSYVRGHLLLTQKKMEDAIDSFSRACNMDRNYLGRVEKAYAESLSSSPNPHLSLALAKVKIEKGQFSRATEMLKQLRQKEAALRGPVVRELRRIIGKEPRSEEAIRVLAELYLEEGKHDLTLSLLEKLIDLGNDSLPWGMKQLKRISKTEPRNSRCLRVMAYAHLRAGNLEESCRVYDQLIELEGEELSRVFSDVREMAQKHPHDVNVLFLQARLLWKRGSTDEACGVFRRLVNLSPSFQQKVITELESMRDLEPEGELCYLTLGELLQREGEYQRSIDNLLKGLKGVTENESIVESHILLANAYSVLGDRKRALKALKMAKTRADSKERFFKRLSELKQERLGFEITKCQADLRSNSKDDSSRIRVARLLRKRGHIEKALEVLSVSLKEPRSEKRRVLEISLCLAEKGELITALETLNSVAVNTPPHDEDLEILYTLATLYGRTGNSLPAVACLKRINQANPRYRQVGNLIAEEYRRLVLFRTGVAARTIMGMIS
jgi:tetratricopeptide (TPR) repeat protein